MATRDDALASVDFLQRNYEKKSVRILDATWGLGKKDSYDDFLKSHIPGAQFFDIDKISDQSVNLPHMVPSETDFEFAMANFGINDRDHVIVYDRSGAYVASARVWWTFKYFGHSRVSVLEGGLSNWIKHGNPVESGPAKQPLPGAYKARINPSVIQTSQQMLDNIKAKRQIIDARPAGRFNGVDPEPRAGLRGGHMPGSVNLPFGDLLVKSDPKDEFLTFLPNDKLSEAFKKVGVDPTQPVATTCGSGVTASVLALGLHLLNNDRYAVYDGSWSEWGQLPPEFPVVKTQ